MKYALIALALFALPSLTFASSIFNQPSSATSVVASSQQVLMYIPHGTSGSLKSVSLKFTGYSGGTPPLGSSGNFYAKIYSNPSPAGGCSGSSFTATVQYVFDSVSVVGGYEVYIFTTPITLNPSLYYIVDIENYLDPAMTWYGTSISNCSYDSVTNVSLGQLYYNLETTSSPTNPPFLQALFNFWQMFDF
jgi:hypothetical protein